MYSSDCEMKIPVFIVGDCGSLEGELFAYSSVELSIFIDGDCGFSVGDDAL